MKRYDLVEPWEKGLKPSHRGRTHAVNTRVWELASQEAECGGRHYEVPDHVGLENEYAADLTFGVRGQKQPQHGVKQPQSPFETAGDRKLFFLEKTHS